MATDRELDRVLDKILKAISPETVAREIGLRYQKARESYTISNSTPDTFHEFLEEVERYGEHQMEVVIGQPVKDRGSKSMAHSDVHRALAEKFGGASGTYEAFYSLKRGTKGGWKRILDAIAESEKSNMERIYIESKIYRISGETGLEYPENMVELMRRYQERFSDLLPDSIRKSPPRLLLGECVDIFRAHARIADKLSQQLRPQREE
jgi:hypothetical protein